MKINIDKIANSQETKALLSLAIDLQAICLRLGAKPIVYGSLAYSIYTNDMSSRINDVDFLISETYFDRLTKAVEKEVLEARCELTTYHSLKVLKNSLKVSFDSIEHYLANASDEFVTVSMKGAELRILNRISLLKCYQQSARTIPSKSEVYATKASALSKTNHSGLLERLDS